MKNKTKKFKTAIEFGKAIGLSNIDMELIQQKKKLIKKLKNKRLELNISQTELANMLGTKQPAIARMESGLVSEVSMDFLLKIAMILNISITIKPVIKMAA